MSAGYLDLLDALLADSVSHIRPEFLARQACFLAASQLPDGSFPGRQGGADRYYIDFALRALTLCAPKSPAIPRAAAYLLHSPPPHSVVECFSRLSALRCLRQCSVALDVDLSSERACLAAHRLPAGGFRRAGSTGASAYATFLAALCYEILNEPLPHPAGAVNAMQSLCCVDGGFRDVCEEGAGQVNATAAAVAVLLMRDALNEAVVEGVTDFLATLQAPDGGVRAHAGAPDSDLLSTFTGMLTLAGFDALSRLNLGAAARFLQRLALPGGGFLACLSDHEPDCEYTYYGLAALAVLHGHLAQR